MENVLDKKGGRKNFFFSCVSFALIISVSQDVCRHMDSVFKELLSRQTEQDPSATAASSPSAQAPQSKGRWDGRKGKGAGLFKTADALE